ncbi:MAG: FAD:protein FMN transferase [Thiogranum sp.]
MMNLLLYKRAMALLISIVWLLSACQSGTQERALTTLQGATMGTTYTVKMVELQPGLKPDGIQAEIDVTLEEINLQMSTYLEDSELSRFNRSQVTDWVEVSQALADVLHQARHISTLTDGAFDVTVGPLVNLWGFGPSPGDDQVPSEQAIHEVGKRVGYRGLQVRSSPPAIKKDRPDLYVDLSAIAKGYAVDAVTEYLQALGIDNYMVEIGGEIQAKGHNARGALWRIAIEKPSTASRSVHTVIELDDVGMATSGDYRNYFETAGRRYSHTIDPVSGRPVTHKLASVTVAHTSTMQADAMATALMVLGPDAGYRFAEQHELAVFFIVKGEDGFYDKASTAFRRYLAP